MTIDEQIPVWLDCDTGNDDAFAILLAAFHPRINLVGISTVHGNAPLDKTTHNTLAVLDVLKVRYNVYRGEQEPLVNGSKFAAEIHGSQGLGGVVVPPVTKAHIATDMTYLQAMREAISKYEGKICFVCTGTLTNFSKLLTTYDKIEDKIRYISIMGGGIDLGNITKWAEFNFNADPHAANHVLTTVGGSKIILAPLNLTHQVRATKAIRDLIYNENIVGKSNDFRAFFYNILVFFFRAYTEKYGITDGPPVHDPIAVYSLFPFIDGQFEKYGYEYIRAAARVVETGEEEGRLIIDKSAGGNQIFIGTKIDATKFWKQLLSTLDVAETHIKAVA